MIIEFIKSNLPGFIRRWFVRVCAALLFCLSLSADTASVVPYSLSRTRSQWRSANESDSSSQAVRRDVFVLDLVRKLHGDNAVFNSVSNTIMTTDESSANLWDAETGKLILTLDGYKEISQANFSSDGRFIITIGKHKNQKNVVTSIWDAETGKLKASLEGYAVFIAGRTLVPESTAITIHDQELRFWDFTTGELKKSVAAYRKVNSDWRFFLDSVISPDGRFIVAYRGKSVPLWDTNTGGLIADLKPPQAKQLFYDYRGRSLEIYQAKFAPDGQTIATIDSYNRVELWQATKGRLNSILSGHLDSIYNIEFSDDGQLIATASRDGTARVWDVTTGQLKNTFKAGDQIARRVRFSPNASILAVGYHTQARLWDVNTGQLRAELPEDKDISKTALFGTYLHGIEVRFSPDGRLLLTMSDKSIRVWEAQTGKFIATLEAARPPVAFSPNGRLLVTRGSDKGVLLWKVSLR